MTESCLKAVLDIYQGSLRECATYLGSKAEEQCIPSSSERETKGRELLDSATECARCLRNACAGCPMNQGYLNRFVKHTHVS